MVDSDHVVLLTVAKPESGSFNLGCLRHFRFRSTSPSFVHLVALISPLSTQTFTFIECS